MKYCRLLSVSITQPQRLVFFDPEKGPDKSQEAASKEPQKSAEQVMAEAKVALDDARREQKNIEEKYGEEAKDGKKSDKVTLKDGTPSAIKEQYAKLGETIKVLEAAQKKPKAVVEATLAQVDAIFAKLEEEAAAQKKRSEGVPLDPMQGLEYKTTERSKKPDVAAEKAAKEAAEKAKKEVAGKGAQKPSETVEAMDKRMDKILQKIWVGENEFDESDKKTLKELLGKNDLAAGEGSNKEQYDVELSKDKKSVRVSVDYAQVEGSPKESTVKIIALAPGAKEKPEFKYKTKDEMRQASLEKNRGELDQQLAWMESKDAPVGSTILIKRETVTRKNPETGAVEEVTTATGIRKGINGLRVVYLESGTDDKGNPIIKEVKSLPYKKETVQGMVLPDQAVLSVEGSATERKAEIKKGMDTLSHNLMAYYTLGDLTGKGFQTALSEMKKAITDHNIDTFVHKDTIVGYQVRVEHGSISILDPSAKNPAYKSPEETPNESRYAVKFSQSLDSVA